MSTSQTRSPRSLDGGLLLRCPRRGESARRMHESRFDKPDRWAYPCAIHQSGYGVAHEGRNTMTRNRQWGSAESVAVLTIVAAALLASPALVGRQQAARKGGQEITFTRDIVPILQRSCQTCHRPGSVAPMSLLTYEEVRPWAKAMKLRTSLRSKPNVMPPWFIEKNVGIQQYKGDISLSDEEIDKIAKWADSGAPRGNPADMPRPLEFLGASEWQIGKPDLIVSSPTVAVKGTSPDWWGPIGESPTDLTEDRYVAAVEMKEVNDLDKRSARQTI